MLGETVNFAWPESCFLPGNVAATENGLETTSNEQSP